MTTPKVKWPKEIIVSNLGPDEYLMSESVDDMDDELSKYPIGVYELVSIGNVRVEKRIDTISVKKSRN